MLQKWVDENLNFPKLQPAQLEMGGLIQEFV
jgi:hypothetical protein